MKNKVSTFLKFTLVLSLALNLVGCLSEETAPTDGDCDKSIGIGNSAECQSSLGQNSPPTDLSYATASVSAIIGTAITSLTPTVTGTVTAYSVSPDFPAGIALDTTTGVISGTPTVAATSTAYTLTASNSFGAATTSITIVVTPPPPPTDLSYPTGSVTGYIGTAITSLTPTVTGTVTAYSVSPAFPAGIALNTITGVISGTPTGAAASTAYTVTASDSFGGDTTTSITIVVTPPPPSSLSYSSSNVTATVGSAITALNPTVSGTVVSYSVNPALPAGLGLNTSTGVVSGTPSGTAASTVYTVTATNAYGSTTTDVTIVVNAPAAPSGLTYSVETNILYKGYALTNLTPSVTGSVDSYSVAPGLPSGLSLNTSTGVISGTPTAAQTQATYTVTATNFTGSTTRDITFQIRQFVAVAVGYEHTCFLINRGTTDGGVACTGRNLSGNLGKDPFGTGDSSSPVWTDVLTLGTGITDIASGYSHSCALKNDGTVYCWGSNGQSQLGLGYSGSYEPAPSAVVGVSGATAITVGTHHSCAVVASGKIQCWGYNDRGQLGNGNTTQQHTAAFVQDSVGDLINATQVSASATHTCARKSDGTVWCWGRNIYGELGVADAVIPNGKESDCSVALNCISMLARQVQAEGGGGTMANATKVIVGRGASYAIKAGGTMSSWGDNTNFQLANEGVDSWDTGAFDCGSDPNGTLNCSTAAPVSVHSAAATALTNVSDAFAGRQHACITTSGGGMKCWGYNNPKGELGDGTQWTAHMFGVNVTGLTTNVSGTITAGGMENRSCGIKAGVASCWGDNNYGQAGRGNTTTPILSPATVLTTNID